MSPLENYQSLMQVVRERFDAVAALRPAGTDSFSMAEAAAFHGRKIVEGIAFGCLIAVEHGAKAVPRDAEGKWAADAIFYRLRKKAIDVLPSPSILRPASTEEQARHRVSVVVEGQPGRRLTHEELIAIYKRMHFWNHEINPYVYPDRGRFHAERAPGLWEDLDRLKLFVERHFISISGEGFFATLWDSQDGRTKVFSASKVADI